MKDARLYNLLFVGGLAGALLLFGSKASPAEHANPSDRAAHGEYLVRYAGCADCHTSRKLGPRGPEL